MNPLNPQLSTQDNQISKTLTNKLYYGPCYGLGCEYAGTHIVLIKLINKIGIFCDKCKTELEITGLIKQELPSIGGKFE